MFLLTRPFRWYQNYFTYWPWPWPLILYPESFNLANNFWTIRHRAVIFHMYVPCDKTFPLVPNYLTLTVTFDLYLENFNFAYNLCCNTYDFHILHVCCKFWEVLTIYISKNFLTMRLLNCRPGASFCVSLTQSLLLDNFSGLIGL